MVKVSVIIPCYNDGHYLNDSVGSVLNSTCKDVEIIIVDDGSTNPDTLQVLEMYRQQGIRVISHPNGGLGYARNQGIKASAGQYILPLDADNKVTADFIQMAANLLDHSADDIVYSKPFFFGEDIPERKFTTYHLQFDELLRMNYIDACAVYRRTVWEQVGGYDEQMPFQGNEDWEFWVSSYLKGFHFKFIEEELFGYRIHTGSMIAGTNAAKLEANQNYILLKHKQALFEHIRDGIKYRSFYDNDQRNYLRTSVKYFAKTLKKIARLK